MSVSLSLTVNGKAERAEIDPRTLLVEFIRNHLALTGTHVGCDTGQCGACTVLIDGMAVKACTILAVQAEASKVTTIEGLATNGKLHPVQQGFWDCHGLQCGFCTPGMIMASVQLLQDHASPSRDEIAHGLHGNLCRCTGYSHIIDAVAQASKSEVARG